MVYLIVKIIIVSERYKMNVKNISVGAVLLTLLVFLSNSTVQAQLKVHENGLIKLHSQAKVKVHDDVNIIGTVSFEDSEMMLEGDWNNNGTFSPGSGTVTFDGTIDQNITGTTTSAFYDLHVNKGSGNVELNLDNSIITRVSNAMRLLSDGLFILNAHDLVLGVNALIYGDMSSNSYIDQLVDFSNTRFIANTAGTLGGYLIKEINSTGTYSFPVGTSSGSSDAYTPAEIDIETAAIGGDAFIKVRPIPEEHPYVEDDGYSLIKYWNVLSNDVDLSGGSADVFFRYVIDEVPGGSILSEYHVLYYSPSLNPSGIWEIDPGSISNVVLYFVDFGEIKSTALNDLTELDGDWTAGQRQAVQAEYWSRQDGPYEDPNTWSRESHTGPPATTYPTKKLDRVHIGNNNIVTINAAPSLSNLLEVTERIPGGLTDTPGTLRINGDFAIVGDTFRLEDNCRFEIAHSEGIDASDPTGAVQTTIREFSPDATYLYFNTTTDQYTGDGIPSPVKELIVGENTADNTQLYLSKNLLINQTLTINNGTFNLNNNTLSGNSSDKTLDMTRDESELFITGQYFPTYFTPQVFTHGTITYGGTGSSTISSDDPISNPNREVLGYKNLKITNSGVNKSGIVTFPQQGSIKVYDVFDISGLEFDPVQGGWETIGSTFEFCGTVSQDVPTQPGTHGADLYLPYGNLILGNGTDATTKTLLLAPAGNATVLNDLTINTSTTFDLANTDIEVRENWINTDGYLVHNDQKVIFNPQTGVTSTGDWDASASNNIFYDVDVNGDGTFRPLDEMTIENELRIEDAEPTNFPLFDMTHDFEVGGDLFIGSTGTQQLASNTLTLNGDWTNDGGDFIPNTSTVTFVNTSVQNLTTSSGTGVEDFYNLHINNPAHLDAHQAADGLKVNITNGLNLINGKLIMRNALDPNTGSWVEIVGEVQGESSDRFVDGEMRKTLNPTNTATTYSFEIGYDNAYTPVEITFNGAGTDTPGTTGIVGIVSELMEDTNSDDLPARAIYTNGMDEVLPVDSDLDYALTIRRQWWIRKPAGSLFNLYDNQYNVTLNYIPYIGVGDEGDIRLTGDADTWMGMDPRLWTGSAWIKPTPRGRWDGTPAAGDRTTSSSSFQNLSNLGHLAIGPADPMVFYSYVHDGSTGEWTDPKSWSVFGYDYGYAPRYPTEDGYLDDIVFIGGNDAGGPYDDEIFVNTTINNFTGTITVETDGKLSFEGQNYIADNGSLLSHFYLEDAGILGVSHINGITDAPTADGNIRTRVREYNYNNHDNAHIIFRDSQDPQASGNGVPNTIGTLTIEKDAGTEVTLGQNLTIENYWYINSGDMVAGADITLNGHLTRESGAGFDPGLFEVEFGGYFDNTVTDNDNLLTFHDVTVNKPNSGDVILAEDSPIIVGFSNGQLTFDASNQGLLNARAFDDDVTRNYVRLEDGGSISGAGLTTGYINGELRMYLDAGDAAETKYEIGTDLAYSPFSLDILSAAQSGGGATDNGVGGYVGGIAYPGFHPALISDVSPPIAPGYAVPRYWRLSHSSSSTFDLGDRHYVQEIYYRDDEDLGYLDTWQCTDMAMVTDWDLSGTPSANWWTMNAVSCGYNDLNSGGGQNCRDTKLCDYENPTPWYRYYGDSNNGLAFTRAGENGSNNRSNWNGSNGIDYSFGVTSLADGSTLLGDFVVGWQNNADFELFTFYSIVDGGDWTDPNSWSTVSYSSTVNEAVTSPNRPPYPAYPCTQYDNANIGNNKEIVLDESIGTNLIIATYYPYAGPTVVVQETGTLNFGTNVLRGNAFTAESGAILKIGSTEGINRTDDATDQFGGNILSKDRAIEDNINLIFTSEGDTPRGINPNEWVTYYYCTNANFTNWDESYHWIQRVRIQTMGGTDLLDNNTGDTDRGRVAFNHISAELTPGVQYNIVLRVRRNTTNSLRVWIDFDRDGSFNNVDELVINSSFSGRDVTRSFTMPLSITPGSTMMRVQHRGGSSSGVGPCDNSTGEIEDYSIIISEPPAPPALTQINGSLMPDNLASIEVRTPRTTAPGVSVFELQKDINVRDYVQITAGTFTVDDAAVDQIELRGDFINYVEDGFVPETIEVLLDGTVDQNILGTETIDFYDLTLDKPSGEVFQSIGVNIAHEMDFQENNIYNVDDDITLNIESSGDIISTGGDFSNSRMIEVTGAEKTAGSNTGTLKKEFLTGQGSTQSFTYPLGTNSQFNPVDITVPATLSGSPSFAINLHRPNHPDFLSGGTNYLRKYWEVATTDIDPISSLKFYYNQSDVFGNQAEYIPGYYYPAHESPGLNGQWEIDLGSNPIVVYTANPVDDWYISLTDVQPLTGDVTVADPFAYFEGRFYYSKLLNAGSGIGDWNVPTNWSTEGHADDDYPSAYYPGELYENDIVYIDGNDQIDYNISDVTIESLIVANTAPSISGTTGTGTLNFITDASQMLITSTTYSIDMANTGAILVDGSGGQSEIEVYGSIINESSGTGFDLYSNSTNNVDLKFSGTTSVNIEGSGNWTDMATVILEKAISTDVVENLSVSLASGSQGFNNNYIWDFREGVLRHNAADDLSISGGAIVLNMGVGTGIESLQGTVSTKNGLLTHNNTYLLLNGGDMNIGDAENEHLLYRTGSEIDLLNGSNLNITGAFAKNATDSRVDFSMTSGTSVKVNNDPDNTHSKTGFDISNTASSFTMDGGEIIVATGSAASTADYNVNATNGGLMTGGTIQSGDGSTITSNPIRFQGTMPIYDFHLVGDGSNTTTRFSGNMQINNLWTVDANNTFEFNSNTADLRGDLVNAGTFDYSNGTLEIKHPSDDQRITNTNGDKIHFYNLTMDKTAGDLFLKQGAAGETNLAVHNTLNFATGNNGVIWTFADGDTPTDTNAFYVEISPAGATVIRSGLGHVFGRLYRYVQAGVSADLEYHIGGETVNDYRRTVFKSYGESGGTAGTVGIINYMQKHYRLEDGPNPLFVEYDTDFEEYWNVNDQDVSGGGGSFDLGAGGTYELTTYFPNTFPSYTGDLDQYEHFIFSPQCPDLPDPSLCPGPAGTWDFTNMGGRGTDGSYIYLKSVEHDDFGDFVAAIPDGFNFYSIASGAWNTSTNWSYDGYEQAAVSDGKYPGSDGRKADNVYIGDDKEITIPSTFSPDLSERYYRIVHVEDIFDGPGELLIEGTDDDGIIFVNQFVLENECLLGVQNRAGLRVFSNQGGAIRTRSNIAPTFGISRYMFYGNVNQETSQSIPDSLAALIVDNTGTSSNNVSLTNLAGITEIGIRDSVLINNGNLKAINRDFFLGGDFYIENEGLFDPNDRAVKVFLDKPHTFRLDNAAGLQLYDLVLDFDGIAAGNKLNIIRNDDALNGITDNLAHLFIENDLTFQQAVIMDGRDDNRKVILQNAASSIVQNDISGNDGWVDGYLGKYVVTGNTTKTFEIGYEEGTDENYTPLVVTFTELTSPGTAGIVEAICNKDYPNEPLNNQNYGHRMDPDHRVPRWWNIQSYEEDVWECGDRSVNVLFEFPLNFITDFPLSNAPGTPDKAVIRRKAIPAEIPLWNERGPSPDIDWTLGGRVTVEINTSGTASDWDGIGDFYIGDKFPRVFYSLTNGDWENNLSWTFNPSHDDDPVPADAYPGSDPLELKDMVEIGIAGTGARVDDIGNMLKDYTIGNITIQGTSSLDMHNGTDGFSLSAPNTSDVFTFELLEEGRLFIGGNENLFTSLFNYDTYVVDTESTVFFDGISGNDQEINLMPTGLNTGLGNVTLSNAGTKRVNNAMLIRGNLSNQVNSLLIIDSCIDALSVYRNLINAGAIENEGVIEIGE
jgi:hypothetical protein